jgi:hypothetical protein
MKLALVGLALGFVVALPACGSRSRLVEAGGAGGAGGGSGGFGAVSGAGGGGGTSVGGFGGSSGCGPVDEGAPCSTLGEIGCLAAFPRCAPIYDDFCCSSCKPTGMCADCMDWRFFSCVDRELSNCVPGMVGPCGQTPEWACQGGRAECTDGPCQYTAGCFEAQPTSCPPGQTCAPECHAVTSETCGPICGPPIPMPMCPNGGVHEVQGGKYSGYCIDPSVCGGVASTCPATMQPGTLCSPNGMTCNYGQCNSCTCQNGVWACVTPPC